MVSGKNYLLVLEKKQIWICKCSGEELEGEGGRRWLATCRKVAGSTSDWSGSIVLARPRLGKETLEAMIHYWLIVCDSINDYQKWPDLILNLLSKLEAQTCKTSQPTHSHCLYLRLALMSPSDLEDFKKECLTANCEPFIRFAIEETCQSGSEWRRDNMELSLILGYVFLSQLW